ncbi:MAG: 50S ribosomal protein L25 [bacterium]|nr:50S ribosomal protein L25 [bacterium]
MAQLNLKGISREKMGKVESRRFRNKGYIPGVLYGKGVAPVPLAVLEEELEQIISTEAGMNAIVSLTLEGEKAGGHHVVMMKDYQADALTRAMTHIDFMKVDLTKKLQVRIPIHLTGKCEGVTKGGLVDQSRREIEVKCLPTNIPNELKVDITALDMGDSIHVDDLKLPEGVEVVRETNFTIVSIVAPAAEEAPTVVPEAATTAEGAAAVPTVGDAKKEAATAAGDAKKEGAAPAEAGKKGEKK